ncbi:MAG: lipid-binding SYLF domain-containing protein [Phycisphaerales bacterium]
MRRITSALVLALAAVPFALQACSTVPKGDEQKQVLNAETQAAELRAKSKDPSLSRFFDSSYAYAVFPDVGKGALIFGGAYGRGQVYRGGAMIGYCDISQGSVGAAIGGQTFDELVFFKDKAAFDAFADGSFTFAAQATAVAINAGAGAANDYRDGVAVFVLPRSGLMVEAAIGGQQLNYRPVSATQP